MQLRPKKSENALFLISNAYACTFYI